MWHTKIVNRVYTLNSSLDLYLLFQNFTTYTIRFHIGLHHHILRPVHKWDLLQKVIHVYSYIKTRFTDDHFMKSKRSSFADRLSSYHGLIGPSDSSFSSRPRSPQSSTAKIAALIMSSER